MTDKNSGSGGGELSDSECILLMGLDVDYKGKRGVKGDSEVFVLSNWVNVMSFTETGNPAEQ